MTDILTSMVELMVAAILVAVIARRLRLPYTVGLLVAGCVLAFGPVDPGLTLSHDLIFMVILPPLLFEAAINIGWKDLRQDALPVLVLAVPGTVIAAAAVTAGCVYLLHWPIQPALLFGVLIAATDPVAVIAMFKDNGVHGRLRLLVESESLLNDGAAAVLFALALAWIEASAQGSASISPGPGQIGILLVQIAGGGILIGAFCAGLAMLLLRGARETLVENAVTFVLAYGSFLLAERFHSSGILACVTSGLLLGNLRLRPRAQNNSADSAREREFTLALWDFTAFIANSFVFLLIGITLAGISFVKLGYGAMFIVILLVLAARALTVYPLCALFTGSRWRVPLGIQHVLWWGGLRGALGLALVLTLPADLPMRGEVLIATFGVVAFSVAGQGLSMPLLLRRLRLIGSGG